VEALSRSTQVKGEKAMKHKLSYPFACLLLWIAGCSSSTPSPEAQTPSSAQPGRVSGAARAQELKNLKFGMFICWSFSTFSGHEWTRGVSDPAYFKASGCDVDQWVKTAKEAGMGYILFLTKHHDGFCLWDTATTSLKATNSPLKKDVLAELRKACDKYGIKLALYFSEGDWTWIQSPLPKDGLIPGSPNWDNDIWRSSKNPELKKAQLKELCTRYGPIEFFWMDHAIGDGGLSHAETEAWIHKFQPGCFVGFNHGEAAGQLCLRERGRAGEIGDEEATMYNKKAEKSYKGYLVAEFTYPIQPECPKGAQWFYSLPENENVCLPAEKIYEDYLGAVKYGNIFSLDVGPRPDGRLRDIDVATLKKVGQYIRGEIQPPK
jgi:alpha-L-fucosidase